jgi:hypothetical protein
MELHQILVVEGLTTLRLHHDYRCAVDQVPCAERLGSPNARAQGRKAELTYRGADGARHAIIEVPTIFVV